MLYDHEMASGEVYRAWRIQARNICEPDSDPVDMFQMHTSIRENEQCAQCKESNRKKTAYYVGIARGVACENCVEFRDPQECIRRFSLLLDQGINVKTETFCKESEREKVIALGRIKFDTMNQAPMDFDVSM